MRSVSEHPASPRALSSRIYPGRSKSDSRLAPPYRRIAGTWLGSREFEEMESGWSTSALSPFNRRSVFVRFIPVNGSARNREGEYCVPHRLALSGNICGTLSGPEQLVMTEPEFLGGLICVCQWPAMAAKMRKRYGLSRDPGSQFSER